MPGSIRISGPISGWFISLPSSFIFSLLPLIFMPISSGAGEVVNRSQFCKITELLQLLTSVLYSVIQSQSSNLDYNKCKCAIPQVWNVIAPFQYFSKLCLGVIHSVVFRLKSQEAKQTFSEMQSNSNFRMYPTVMTDFHEYQRRPQMYNLLVFIELPNWILTSE